jgi:hypothetical protein
MKNSNQDLSVHYVSHQDLSSTGEDTLRLIAGLPAPAGLEDRVQAGLRAAPAKARILHWPTALLPSRGLAGSWMRSAAAAAIVVVVAGGGWGIYSRVQPSQPARVLVMPPRVGAGGGFSNAGAMRTPQTLNGPVLLHPAPVQPVQAKTPARTAKTPLSRGQAAGKAAVQPVAPVAK